MENRVDLYRRWKVEFIINVLNVSFDFEWTELFVIKFITRFCYFDIFS
jgi:hypothetical protein